MKRQWTPEQDDALRKMIAEGCSFRDIAQAFGVTRNAAIGRANRIGVEHPRARKYRVSHTAVHQLRKVGVPYRRIAEIVGCHPGYAAQIGCGWIDKARGEPPA